MSIDDEAMECVLTAKRGPVDIGSATAKVNGETACMAEFIFTVEQE